MLSRLQSSPLHRRVALRRVGFFVLVVALATLAGLYWRSARPGRVLDAGISLRVDAAVQADGALSVNETVAVDPDRLDGRRLTRRLPTPEGVTVVFREVTDEAGRPLPFLARQESSDEFAVRVGPRDNSMVALHYELRGAVHVTGSRAVAVVHWLEEGSELELDAFSASIVWSEGGGPPSEAAGFAGDERLDAVRSPSGVRFDAGHVPAHVAAGGGAVFLAAAVPGVEPGPAATDVASLAPDGRLAPTIGDGDGRWNAAGVALGIAVVAAWALLQRARGNAYEPPPHLTEIRPPSSHTPAEVGWLLRLGEVRHGDLTGTLIDLASRGYLISYRRENLIVMGPGRPPEGLRAHEHVVLEWLFPGRVRECDLEARNAEIRREPEAWAAMWERFVEEVRAVGRSSGLVERPADSPAVLGLGFAGVVVVALGVAGLAAGHLGWAACIVAGAVVMANSTAFARRSVEGALLAARWEAFGRALRDEAAGKLELPADLGPQALAYAVALHESEAAAVVLAAHQTDADGGRWPTQLMDREVAAHVNRWRESYLVATSIKGEPSQRVRALLSLRALRRATTTTVKAHARTRV